LAGAQQRNGQSVALRTVAFVQQNIHFALPIFLRCTWSHL